MGGRDAAGWWCRDNDIMCSEVWWCDVSGILWSTCIGVCLWASLFAFLCLLLHPLFKAIEAKWPSKFENEQQVSWLALHVQSTIHACLMAGMASYSLWDLFSADPRAQLDAPSFAFLNTKGATARIANASHIFFCYTIVDTFVTTWRKAMTLDYFFHHMVFTSFCVLIQYHCFAGYLAGWLLVMETSTIFLNGFTFWRNRLGYDHNIVRVSFLLFGLTFFAFRLIGTIHIAYYWTKHVLQQSVPFHGIPRWHLYVICVALVGAVVLQIFWAAGIIKNLIKTFTTDNKATKSS